MNFNLNFNVILSKLCSASVGENNKKTLNVSHIRRLCRKLISYYTVMKRPLLGSHTHLVSKECFLLEGVLLFDTFINSWCQYSKYSLF